MIIQGLAPSFWGPLSDTKGRRLTFIGELAPNFRGSLINFTTGTFLVYLAANVGLAFSNDFTYLMIFRGIQYVKLCFWFHRCLGIKLFGSLLREFSSLII